MAFYWRGNQLFTKHGPTGDNDKVWTIFLMDMREPTEVIIYSIKNYNVTILYLVNILCALISFEKFARFLANSLVSLLC